MKTVDTNAIFRITLYVLTGLASGTAFIAGVLGYTVVADYAAKIAIFLGGISSPTALANFKPSGKVEASEVTAKATDVTAAALSVVDVAAQINTSANQINAALSQILPKTPTEPVINLPVYKNESTNEA